MTAIGKRLSVLWRLWVGNGAAKGESQGEDSAMGKSFLRAKPRLVTVNVERMTMRDLKKRKDRNEIQGPEQVKVGPESRQPRHENEI